jgi:hypothetical protein
VQSPLISVNFAASDGVWSGSTLALRVNVGYRGVLAIPKTFSTGSRRLDVTVANEPRPVAQPGILGSEVAQRPFADVERLSSTASAS